MKVAVVIAMVLSYSTVNAVWFFGRNSETTATANGRAVSTECIDHGEAGSCEFFDCFEQRLPCGRDWYMQRFGNHYCNRFQTNMETFTEAGQEFLSNTQQCLTRRLIEFYRRDFVKCHDLEHAAIAAIGPCYRQHGFCDIIVDNTQQFLNVFQVNDLFNTGASKLWKEMFKLAQHCGGRAFSNFLTAAAANLSPLRALFNSNDDK